MRPHSGLIDGVEFADNPEPRCPCLLLLDTSGSMRGERINSLNEGLRTFHRELLGDSLASRRVEVAVVTFDSAVRVVQPFVTAERFTPPLLTASGGTSMGAGIDQALTLVEKRKAIYLKHGVPYYRPWILMITDGKPEGEPPAIVAHAQRRLVAAEERKGAVLFTVAVEGADMAALRRLVPREPYELERLQFSDLFVWLSTSMQMVSHSKDGDTVDLPPVGWMKQLAQFIDRHEHTIADGARIIRILSKVALGI